MSDDDLLPTQTTPSSQPNPWLVWIADHTLWLLILVAPLLLFSRGIIPWLGLALVLAGWLMRFITGRLFYNTSLEPSLILLACMATLGWIISIDPNLSAPRFWSLILGLLAFVEFAQITLIPRRARTFTIFLFLATLGVAGLTLIGGNWDTTRLIDPYDLYKYLPSLIRGLPDSGVAVNDLINLRWLGITLGFLLPIPISVLLWGLVGRFRILAGITTVSAMFVLLLTQSLQGLFGLAAGVFFLLAWRWRWLLWVGIAFFLVAGVFVLILRQWVWVMPILSLDTFAGLGVSLRLDIWSRAWAMLKDMPLTGVGLNTFPLQIRNFYPGFAIGDEPHAHQLYLQTALDLGVPGLLAFLWAMVLWFRRLSVNYQLAKDQMSRALYLGLTAGVIAYLAHGFLDSLMLGAKPGILLWVMLGLGAARPLGEESKLPRKPNGQITMIWAFFATILMLLGLIIVAIFRPASLEINVATLQAHLLLLQEQVRDAEPSLNLTATLENLQRLADMDPGNRTANDLTGRLLLKSGDYPAAIQYFYQVVNLDRLEPFKEYNPPAYLARRLQSLDRFDFQHLQDLAELYNRWTTRYPELVEYVLLEAILYEHFLGSSEQAIFVLEQGLANPALSQGALGYYRDQVIP